MTLQQLLSTDLANRLGWALAHSIWEGAVVAAAQWVALAVLRRRSPQARYLVSTGAMALMLLSGVITFCLAAPPAPSASLVSPSPSLRLASVERRSSVVNLQGSPVPAGGSWSSKIEAAPTAQAGSATPSPPVPSVAMRLEPAMRWAVGAWAVGVVLLSLWNLGGWIAAQRLTVLGIRPANAELTATAEILACRLQLSKPVRVVQSLLAETPVVIGWLRPVVLLPASVLTGLTAAQLEAVLAHELAHIRRHDYLMNLFQVAVETLLFYHPAVWWMSRRIRLEREQCCDDVAVSVCGDRRAYVESLAALEEMRLAGMLALSASGSGGSQLLVRIRRLLGLRDDSPRRGPGAMIAVALLLLAVLVSVALWGKSSQTKADTRVETTNAAPHPATRSANQPDTHPGEDSSESGPSTGPASQAKTDGLPIDLVGSIGPYDRVPQEDRAGKGAQPVPVVFQVSEDNVPAIVRKFDAHQTMAVDIYDRTFVKPLGHGSLVGIDNQIDPATGTLKCKAIVQPVGDALLFPNQFVNVRLHLESPRAGAPATQPGFVPRLEFRLVAEPGDKSDADEMADGKQPIRVLKTVELDEREVTRAYSMKVPAGARAVGVDFTEAGSKKFAALTGANIHHRLAIVLDGRLLSAPKIQTMIFRSAVITPDGELTDRQVQALADSINALARGAPATAPSTQPADSSGSAAPPQSNGELLRTALADLARDYALKDGEVIRIIRPPFSKARSRVVQLNYGVTADDADKVHCVCFTWKDGIARPGAWYKQDISLESTSGAVTGLSWSQFDGDALRAFAWPGLHGDLVVRADVTPDQKLKAFISLIEQETNTRVEVTYIKMKRTCIVLHGGTDLPGYAYVNPDADGRKVQLSRLAEERERILGEIAGYESRRDSLARALNEGRTPPDIEQRIHDTGTYTHFRNQVIALEIELKRLEQFNGPQSAQVVEVKRMKDAWQAQVDEEHEELKSTLTEGMKAALDSEISASVANLARIDEFIKKADGSVVGSEPKSNVEGRGGFAVFITARPLDDAVLSRWAKGLTLHGTMGRPNGMGMFFGPEAASYNIGAPFVFDANDNGQFWRTSLFLVADDVAGWHADDPGFTEKVTHVLDNLKKQVGGDWRIEKREFNVLSLLPAAGKK